MARAEEPEFGSIQAATRYLESTPEPAAFTLSGQASRQIYQLHEQCQELLKQAKSGVPDRFALAKATGGYFRTLFGGATGQPTEVVKGLRSAVGGTMDVLARNRSVTENYNMLVAQDRTLVAEINLFNEFGAALRKRRFDGIPICVYMYADRTDRMRFYPDQTGGDRYSFELYPKTTDTM